MDVGVGPAAPTSQSAGAGQGAGAVQYYAAGHQPYLQQPSEGTGMSQGAGSAQLYTPAQQPTNTQSQLQTLTRRGTYEIMNSIGERETHHTDGTIDILIPSGCRFQEE